MGKFKDWLSNRRAKKFIRIDKLPSGEFQTTVSNYEYSPEGYSQDSSQSIICNGKYDMTRFSAHEDATIKQVVYNSKAKYPLDLLAMGMANESYTIVYKPRYVLFEMIIIAFENSLNPFDQIAVSFAYIQKGAQYRQNAIRYFETAIPRVSFEDLNRFSSFNVGSLFLAIGEVYEKEHDYKKAIQCYTEAKKASWINKEHLEQKIEESRKKDQDWKPLRRRPVTEEQLKFEYDTRMAAQKYLSLCGLEGN